MKAVVCQNKRLFVEERPEPIPETGQLLVKVLRCGICGSDLHVRQHCDHWGRLMSRHGYKSLQSSDQAVVMGHEFSAEVLDTGPRTRTALKPGTPIVAVPLLRRGKDIDLIGLSTHSTGAYAERMLVQATLALRIPNGLSPTVAALTEPMAVGWHAVVRSQIRPREVAIVIGCGPVGLAVISMLKAKGVRTIIASDFSPTRRAMAERCGATQVVDPATTSPYANWKALGFQNDLPGLLELAVGSKEQLDKVPLPWWHLWALGERLGIGRSRPIVFECVGVPGVLQSIISDTPQFSRIVGVGVCMQTDQIEPAIAINKEIDIRFAVGYTPLEFRQTLHILADGKVDAAPLITGTVALGGVAGAFDVLANPGDQVKILIDPAA
jgi:threonine dehydrogenase-like Zn-dependent dehydrogenase